MTQPNFIAAYIVDPSAQNEALYLLIRRSQKSYLAGIWQMVTGKLKVNELAHIAAQREIYEETGLKLNDLYHVDVTMFYEQTKNRIAYSVNFCAYADNDTPLRLSEKEHDTYQWCTFNEAFSLLAFPSQKETLLFIHNYYVLRKPNPVNRVALCVQA